MFKKLLLTFTITIFLFNLVPTLSFALEKDLDNSEKEEKIIYLTFDDGPSKNTEKILDLLKKENVPATFFLMGKLIEGNESIVKRINDEGHGIGLHSFSHDRNKIYSSKENLLKEMLKTQKIIEDIIGEKVYILRFPFGSNNNSFKLKESWVKLLHENNLKIYDWNLDSNDGIDVHCPPYLILKHSISTNDNIVLLMHCAEANKTTITALPDIISYYKNKGYKFKKITIETPEIYKILK